MDIDEFLDREISASSTPHHQVSSSATKEDLQKPALPEQPVPAQESVTEPKSIQTVLSVSGPFDSLLTSYQGLWEHVQKMEFSYDATVREQLATLANQMKQSYKELASEVSTKRNQVHQFIATATRFLASGHFGQAQRAYDQAKTTFDSINDFFVEEKKNLYGELFTLYHKIKLHLDSDAVVSSRKELDNARAIIHKAFSCMKKRDLDGARSFYLQAVDYYNALPNVHVFEKIKIGELLLELYREVSIHTQISVLQSHLSDLNYGSAEDIDTSHSKPQLHSKHHRHIHNQHLIKQLIGRKMNRAKLHLEKGYKVEAQKDLQAVLKLDPNHKHAKQLLHTLHTSHRARRK